MTNEDYMRLAIDLAKKGAGWTSPNPLVGAVIVKNEKIIGKGFHKKYGELHAERDAIKNLTEPAEGAVLFVTLEPCCHHGKQPPCTEAIIEAGISTVYIGSRDPNPLVAGKGTQFLREHGITVIEDFLRNECDLLNPVFFHYISTRRPFVAMKYAMTLDGKIATKTGASKWITGEAARSHVHSLRSKYASILVGINTVLLDNPLLNCRSSSASLETSGKSPALSEYSQASRHTVPDVLMASSNEIYGIHQPLRIVLDSRLQIPTDCQLVRTAHLYPTMVVCAVAPDTCNPEQLLKWTELEKKNVTVVSLPEENNVNPDVKPKVSITRLLDYLGQHQVDSIFVEGGGQIHDAFLQERAVNKVYCYIAPKLFGGNDAKSPVGGVGFEQVSDALQLEQLQVTGLGSDILLEGDVVR